MTNSSIFKKIVRRSLGFSIAMKSAHNWRSASSVVISLFAYLVRVRTTQEKVYAVDVALMNQREDAFVGDNLGWRLETMVLNHLVRKSKMEETDIYYLKERAGECDFVVCKGNKVLLEMRCRELPRKKFRCKRTKKMIYRSIFSNYKKYRGKSLVNYKFLRYFA